MRFPIIIVPDLRATVFPTQVEKLQFLKIAVAVCSMFNIVYIFRFLDNLNENYMLFQNKTYSLLRVS